MRTIAKFHVSSFKQWPGSPTSGALELGAVCRGDENRTWAASTPAGSLTIPADHPDGAAALDAFDGTSREVHVLVEADPDGEWEFKSCDFAYAGVEVKFERTKRPAGDHRPGVLTMTVNAEAAGQSLRTAFAESLTAGAPARFRVWTEPVDTE